jgi:aspartate carbamoyltransferase catalytic subunit
MLQSSQYSPFRHLLAIKDLNKNQLETIFSMADEYFKGGEIINRPVLKSIKVANLFFEPSTRTRVTFEIAAKSLSADVINLNIDSSSTKKGEGLIDTLQNLEMMGIKIFVIRHSNNGAAHFFARYTKEGNSVINAGDGSHEHPTQALLDMAVLRKYRGDFENMKVAIVGDVLHSRVARSQIHALKILGTKDIRVIAPNTLVPNDIESMGVQFFQSLEEGLNGVNVILCLRLQRERMATGLIPSEKEFFKLYGISSKSLPYADKDALVLHPGPVNRGIEIASDVVDGRQSVILNQVTQGIAVRMAVMTLCQSQSIIPS